jgi:hypothetical protein
MALALMLICKAWSGHPPIVMLALCPPSPVLQDPRGPLHRVFSLEFRDEQAAAAVWCSLAMHT